MKYLITFLLLFTACQLEETILTWDKIDEDKILHIVNLVRLEEGNLDTLVLDSFLIKLAREHCNLMSNAKIFSHSKKIPSENIAYGYDTIEEVLQAWMNSPGHRENILDSQNRRMGIAKKGIYWTQNFSE